ncbi:MAG: RHS repeat protein, partial [Burkholderiales bacterium]|nr:RHS repeat protein [Burkholderiales bacterium]
MGTWSYAYNALGELIRQTDAKGQVTTLFYDKLGRLTQRSEPNLVSNWYFDKDDSNASCGKSVGKLCVAKTDGGYRRTLAYDGLGRPYSLTATIDAVYTVTTAYVASGANLGKVDTVTYPTGFAVKHVYNATGYLSEVRKLDDNSLLWRANSRTAAGQILNETLGNGLSTATTYDALNRPTQIVSGATGNTVQDMSFGYDLAGNLVSRIDAVQAISESFQYDSLNRLKESTGLNLATNTALATRRVDYDALGNIISKSDVGSYVYPVAGAAWPHAVSYITGARAANYSYDANGNLTGVQYANGNSRTLTYASFGLPTRVEGTVASGPSYRYDYSYNAEHERV